MIRVHLTISVFIVIVVSVGMMIGHAQVAFLAIPPSVPFTLAIWVIIVANFGARMSRSSFAPITLVPGAITVGVVSISSFVVSRIGVVDDWQIFDEPVRWSVIVPWRFRFWVSVSFSPIIIPIRAAVRVLVSSIFRRLILAIWRRRTFTLSPAWFLNWRLLRRSPACWYISCDYFDLVSVAIRSLERCVVFCWCLVALKKVELREWAGFLPKGVPSSDETWVCSNSFFSSWIIEFSTIFCWFDCFPFAKPDSWIINAVTFGQNRRKSIPFLVVWMKFEYSK